MKPRSKFLHSSFLCIGLGLNALPTLVRAQDVSEPSAAVSAPIADGALPATVVEGDAPPLNSYAPTVSETSLRLPAEIMEVPVSVQVIPRVVIDDQAVFRAADATRNVSNVMRKPAYLGVTDSYTIRGFNSDIGLWNGLRRDMYYSFTDVSALESVEVLKGPASATYGFFEPGGVVSYVTKRPTAEPIARFESTLGSESFFRPSLDLGGPLTADGLVRYRWNTAYETSESFRDHLSNELIATTLAVDWDLSETTTLFTEFSFLRSDSVPDRGFDNSLGPVTLTLPRERFLGDPRDSYLFEQYDSAIWIESEIGETGRFRLGFHTNFVEDFRDIVQQGSLGADGRTLERFHSVVSGTTEFYEVFGDYRFALETGPVEHELMIGGELSRRKFPYLFREGSDPFLPLDIFDPVYGSPSRPLPPVAYNWDDELDNLGLYLQDFIRLNDQWSVLAGARYDLIDYSSADAATGDSSSFREHAVSPRAGITYRPVEEVAFFGNFGMSFRPNTWAVTQGGGIVDPETGEQFEGGVKTQWLDGRITAGITGFHIVKENVAIPDPADPTGFFYIASGEQRSRGAEVDFSAEIIDGLQVLASFGYVDAEITRDTFIPVGDRLVNAPEHTASLWAKWEFQHGPLKGLGLGAGVFHFGDREAAMPNTYEIPGYTRFDALLYYQMEDWKVALNVKNVFDETYFDSQDNLLYPGAPTQFFLTVGREF